MEGFHALLVPPSEAHDASENSLSILELLDTVLEEGSLPSCVGRLRHQAFQLVICHVECDQRREDALQIPNHMAFNDLSNHIGDEGLLLYLLICN